MPKILMAHLALSYYSRVSGNISRMFLRGIGMLNLEGNGNRFGEPRLVRQYMLVIISRVTPVANMRAIYGIILIRSIHLMHIVSIGARCELVM